MLSWGSPYINISILPTNSPSQCLAPSFMPIRRTHTPHRDWGLTHQSLVAGTARTVTP
jgi:hypothetical protein